MDGHVGVVVLSAGYYGVPYMILAAWGSDLGPGGESKSQVKVFGELYTDACICSIAFKFGTKVPSGDFFVYGHSGRCFPRGSGAMAHG